MEIKNAIVTGAASGMGRISAKRLAADGVRVAAVDINEENLNQLRQESNNISIFLFKKSRSISKDFKILIALPPPSLKMPRSKCSVPIKS